MDEEKKSVEKKRRFPAGARYLREISVVVIGVAITFLVSGWIAGHREKKELTKYLRAVKMETQYNVDLLKSYQPFYDRMEILSQYLVSVKRENLDMDSVWYYAEYYPDNFVINNFFSPRIETSALEMLKTSGTMNSIGDVEFSRGILESYKKLEGIKRNSDDYMERKRDILYKTLHSNQLLFTELDLSDPRASEMFYFLATSHSLHRNNKESIEVLEKLLESFDLHKIR